MFACAYKYAFRVSGRAGTHVFHMCFIGAWCCCECGCVCVSVCMRVHIHMHSLLVEVQVHMCFICVS